MPSQPDLDKLAWDFLMAPKLYNDALKRQVLGAGAKIVFPLLHGSLKHLESVRANTINPGLGKRLPEQVLKLAYGIFAASGKSVVTDVAEINTAIGQPAWDSTCRALTEKIIALRVLASLILVENKNPSLQTAQNIKDAFSVLGLKDNYFAESGMGYLLFLVVARSGDKKYEWMVNDVQSSSKITREEYETRSQNSAWLYLLEHGFSK